jgi:guanine nucleotide-binding protein subunit alpha
MGNCLSPVYENENRKANRQIEKQLQMEKRRQAKIVRVLLLGKFRTRRIIIGAGESGKSTIMKQMKIMYTGGFSSVELLQYKPDILNNVVEAIQQVINALKKHEYAVEDERTRVRML